MYTYASSGMEEPLLDGDNPFVCGTSLQVLFQVICVCAELYISATPIPVPHPPPPCCVGYFLCVHKDDQSHLTLRPSDKSEAAASLFCFRRCTNRGLLELQEGKVGGTMGEPCVKFGDSSVYLQHVDSKKWLGYQVSDDGCAVMIAVMMAVQ